MNDLCTEVRFVYDDGDTAPASIDGYHTSRWLTDVAASPVRLRYFCRGATIECGDGPLCEFGRWGPGAEYWAVGHLWTGQLGRCTDCGVWQSQCCEPEEWCHSGDGGIYGMCGYRPLNAEELANTVFIGVRQGPRPYEDLRNVVPCDGTITVDAILYGPIWIARQSIRDNLSQREPDFVCKLLGRHEFDDANQCVRCGVIRTMMARTES